MKLGLGLYRHMLTPDNYRFAKQAGATHIVAHLVDYFAESPALPAATSTGSGWGVTTKDKQIWTVDELADLKREIEQDMRQLSTLSHSDITRVV